jgi:predicted nucleic acid-binding protein
MMSGEQETIGLSTGKAYARCAVRSSLRVAGQFAVSACDARFLAAAQSLGGRLVTEDAKLRAAAPALTQSLGEALEA